MALILSIGRCTNLNLFSIGRSLLLGLERAGIDANKRKLPPVKILSAPIFPLPILLARYDAMVHAIGC